MDYMEAQEIKEIMSVRRGECPCGEPLEHFSGLDKAPDYLYCPRCLDKGYNADGEVIVRLE